MSLLRREKRPPVEPADWRDVTTFTIGSTERPPTAEGTRVGVIQRLPRKGPRRHTWRIEQPNRSWETQDLHPTHRHADWLDRPLAFTFALIGDTPPLTG
ncbi:hypothetical protein [Streptomyces albidoflavus]|uniref:hypothetical protein n=1 Tax=Streptomyces albidoflavus TaxID=1886 RepID=UPI0033EC3E8E